MNKPWGGERKLLCWVIQGEEATMPSPGLRVAGAAQLRGQSPGPWNKGLGPMGPRLQASHALLLLLLLVLAVQGQCLWPLYCW